MSNRSSIIALIRSATFTSRVLMIALIAAVGIGRTALPLLHNHKIDADHVSHYQRGDCASCEVEATQSEPAVDSTPKIATTCSFWQRHQQQREVILDRTLRSTRDRSPPEQA